MRPSCLTFGVTSACPMLTIWWLTYLARAGLSPAGIIDLARPHTPLVLLREAVQGLVATARNELPDRFANIDELGSRPIYAIDATYQKESSHYQPVYPGEGGSDNKKGHMAMTTYDMRAGIAVDSNTETTSIDEMRFIKEGWIAPHWTCQKNALYVIDRAFIDARYWDLRKTKYSATVITRMKTVFKYQVLDDIIVISDPVNEGVLWDKRIQLNSSKQEWRLIQFISPDGKTYEYLTNDFTLSPGMIAFLYHRRWDEEKYFDNYKTDMANSKAWAKSPIAIEQQALLGLVTHVLMRLFLHQKGQELDLEEDHQTQQKRHEQKETAYCINWEGIYNRAFFKKLSKITKQAWRFLKNNFLKRSSQRLFECKLRPALTAYL
ncbi:transposase [Methyloprofundus sp.]|uniref:transposase n=1 Tax=Methyloprofundus sp. TaxID=2020875 RepID=UPI003D102A17